MGRRLAHEQEMPVRRPHRLADRLAGEQVVAQIDRLQPGVAPAMALQPAPDRPAFAVLLLVAVLGHDEFRLQRHHPVVVGRHDRRRHHRVEVLGPVLAALAGRALLAMDLARHVIFGAVQGDQHVAAKLAESLQAAGPLQFRHHLGEDRMEVVGTDRVQQRPDMIVAGDLVQAEQRLAIRPPLSLLQTALMRQERRALHEEQGKRRQADVRHRVARITSLPEVRQRVAAPAQRPDETIQDFHDPEKPDFRRRGNPPKALHSNFSARPLIRHAHSRDSVSVGFRTAGAKLEVMEVQRVRCSMPWCFPTATLYI